MQERIVHGYTADGAQIVRYNTTSTWWVEDAEGNRTRIDLLRAASAAAEGEALLGLPGGHRFSTEVKAIKGQLTYPQRVQRARDARRRFYGART